jgi:hypothetical protein
MKESSEREKERKNFNYKTIFIRCDCQSELLVLDYDGEVDMVFFSLYETDLSHKHKMSLWQKARYIYQVLRHGEPYMDQITLNRDQINELKAFLETI